MKVVTVHVTNPGVKLLPTCQMSLMAQCKTKNKKVKCSCLPINKTMLSDKTLSLIPRQFAVEPGLSQVNS